MKSLKCFVCSLKFNATGMVFPPGGAILEAWPLIGAAITTGYNESYCAKFTRNDLRLVYDHRVNNGAESSSK